MCGDGKVVHAATSCEQGYGDLASTDEAAKAFEQMAPGDVTVTPVKEWKVLGTFVTRPNRRDIVTGGVGAYPSDIIRKGIAAHGKILRQASYGAKLTGVDLAAAKAIAGVKVARGRLHSSASPRPPPFRPIRLWMRYPRRRSGKRLSSRRAMSFYDYSSLKQHVRGGIPKNPFAGDVAKAAKSLKQEYHVAYIQHAPMLSRGRPWPNGTAASSQFGPAARIRSECAARAGSGV